MNRTHWISDNPGTTKRKVHLLLQKREQPPYNPSRCSFLFPLLSATGQCNIILSLLLKHPATNYCCTSAGLFKYYRQRCGRIQSTEHVKSITDFTQGHKVIFMQINVVPHFASMYPNNEVYLLFIYHSLAMLVKTDYHAEKPFQTIAI